MRADKGRKVAVVIMGSNVHFKNLCQIRNFLGLGKTVPNNINANHIHRMVNKVWKIIPDRIEIFTGTNRKLCRALYFQKSQRIKGIDLKPKKIKFFECSGNLDVAFGFKIKIKIKDNSYLFPRSLLKCSNLGKNTINDLPANI